MELDLEAEHAPNVYKLLAGLVTPRPIAWVTSIDGEGRVNAAPFSFFNVFGSRPPLLAFAPGDREPGVPKDTARNIRATREFVVNLVDEATGEAMNQTSTPLPYGVSELDHAGLTAAASRTVRPPRIAESPVSLECREWATIEVGSDRLVIGTVRHLHVRDGILDPDTLRVIRENYCPIGRMQAPDWYCRTRDMFELTRPE